MTPNIKDNHVNTSRVSKCPVCDGKGRVPYGFYVMGNYVPQILRVGLNGERFVDLVMGKV